MLPSSVDMIWVKKSDLIRGSASNADFYDKNITAFYITSVYKGLYLSFLCSFLPIINAQEELILFSVNPCWLHLLISTFSMMTWSFLVIFVQSCTLLNIEAKASSKWKKSSDPLVVHSQCSSQRSSPDNLLPKKASSMQNEMYNYDHSEYLENMSNRRLNLCFSFFSFYESTGGICRLGKNSHALISHLLVDEANMECSTIYRLLIVVLNTIGTFEAVCGFLLPKGISFLLTSVVDLVIVLHLSNYAFAAIEEDVIGKNCTEIPVAKIVSEHEGSTEANNSGKSCIYNKSLISFPYRHNKLNIQKKKKKK